MTNFFSLIDRSIIEISGLDSKEFLQGLITNDINKISDKSLTYSCMLNAQGRFLYDFFIFSKDEKIFIDCYLPRRDEIVKKLNFYKLRSKVEIEINDEIGVFFSKENGEGLSFEDSRNVKMGYRSYFLKDKISINQDQNNYHYTRIINKIPEGEYDLTYEKSFILEFGFDKLNAVDYSKGCYVGQEPTARIHHLGQIRKEVVYTKLSQELEKNSKITCEDQTLGVVLSSVSFNGEIHALILKAI